MNPIDRIKEAWAAGKAHRMSLVAEDPYGEYDRLDKLRHINKEDLP